MTVTHVFVLKAPANFDHGPRWQEALASLAKHSGSPVYSGRQAEDESKIWLLSDWQSQENYQGAASSAIDALVSGGLAEVESNYSVDLKHADRTACEKPTTEISIGFFLAGDQAAAGFEQVVRDYSAKVEANQIDGCAQGVISGWTVDRDIPFATLEGGTASGQGFFSLLGWQSQAAHYAFNETDFVRNNAGAIAGAGAKGWVIAHVDFVKTAA